MEDTVGRLLDDHDVSVSVYEDLTGGLVADRLNQANADRFVEGIVANGLSSIRRLLASSRDPESTDMLLGDPASLTQELAWCVRAGTESDLGLAVHTVPDPDESVENLAAGQTYISVTDGKDFRSRTYPYGGRGRPDRTRMSLNAIEQVRVALVEGFQ